MKERLFDPREDMGRGRLCVVTSNVLNSVITSVGDGVFYTAFLLMSGITLTNIGIVSLVPYMAACLGVFAPVILERLPRRRWILAAGTLIYQGLNLIGITLLPALVGGTPLLIPLFVALLLLSNTVKVFVTNGYTAWHLNFLPDGIRTRYFSFNFLLTQTFALSLSLVLSLVADKYSGAEFFPTLIRVFRYALFALAIADAAIKSIPREYSYPVRAKALSIKELFTVPFANKNFMKTTLIYVGLTVTTLFYSSYLNVLYLDELGVSYTVIGIINALYPVFIFAVAPLVRHTIGKVGWMRAFLIAYLIHGVTNLFNLALVPDNLTIFIAVRLSEHISGVFISITATNIPFLMLPDENRVTYLSFQQLMVNAFSFIAVMLGTAAVTLTEAIPNLQISGIQLLTAACGILMIGGAAFVYFRYIHRADSLFIKPIE